MYPHNNINMTKKRKKGRSSGKSNHNSIVRDADGNGRKEQVAALVAETSFG